jgi:hypothetical protein
MDCRNVITLTGPQDSLNSLTNIAIKRDVDIYADTKPKRHTQILPYVFNLESLHPNPFNDEVGDAHEEERQRWYCENHGTSKTCLFEEIENSDEKYIVKFWSSFAPPLRAFEKISRDYPDLTIEVDFWGVGSGFCGMYAYRNGECIQHKDFENDEYDALFIKEPEDSTYEMPDSDDGMDVNYDGSEDFFSDFA